MIHDVVIAGAGPVGLFCACELRLADLSVLVLERAVDPHSPLKRLPFGMRGLSVPTIEAFYRRGLLGELAAPPRARDEHAKSASAPTEAPGAEKPRRQAGHFAGVQAIRALRPRDQRVPVCFEAMESVRLAGQHPRHQEHRPRQISGDTLPASFPLPS